jgi:hypothetical protein
MALIDIHVPVTISRMAKKCLVDSINSSSGAKKDRFNLRDRITIKRVIGITAFLNNLVFLPLCLSRTMYCLRYLMMKYKANKPKAITIIENTIPFKWLISINASIGIILFKSNQNLLIQTGDKGLPYLIATEIYPQINKSMNPFIKFVDQPISSSDEKF